METYDQHDAYANSSDHGSGAELPQNPNHRRAVGTAAAGTVALGAAAYALSRLDDGESDGDALADNGLNTSGDGSGLNGANANGDGLGSSSAQSALASNANAGNVTPVDNRSLDDMTFEEAFAAARQSMGAGKTFTWHGGLYNTFHEEELNAMSTAERLAFVESLGLEEDEPAGNTPRPAARVHHPQTHHSRHHDAPQLADNDRSSAPEIQPIAVMPLASVSPEVTPLSTEIQSDHVDMLAADNTNHNPMGPAIESVDDQHEHSDTDAQHALDHSASDDDDPNAHFAY